MARLKPYSQLRWPDVCSWIRECLTNYLPIGLLSHSTIHAEVCVEALVGIALTTRGFAWCSSRCVDLEVEIPMQILMLEVLKTLIVHLDNSNPLDFARP